jgi:hypothetical protein
MFALMNEKVLALALAGGFSLPFLAFGNLP